MPDPAVQPLGTQVASLLPSSTPTILSSAVATALNATPQSPMAVQAVQFLPIGPPPPAPAPSKLPFYAGVGGVVAMAGLLGYLVLRKKRRK